MNRRLRAWLRRRGATSDTIDDAARDGWLTLLALDRAVMPGRPRHTFAEAAERAELDLTTAMRLWRGLGFPDPPVDAKGFTDEDVDAMQTLRRQFTDPGYPFDAGVEDLVEQVRTVGAGLARIAEVLSDRIVEAIRDGRALGLSDEETASVLVQELDWARLERLIDYALRLQVRAASWRKLAVGEGDADQSLAVGFVDLVGFTALSQELEEHELAELVGRFEELAYDTVATNGGRVVKTIGDEVMFVAASPAAATRIAVLIIEHSTDDDVLPEARAGLSFGTTVAREGDYYGPVVNLAHRIVELARPGTVVATEELHDVLDGDDAFEWRRLRARRLRDIGTVQLWAVRSSRAGQRAGT